MHRIASEIEIARSPAQVRAIFLDFASYPQWQTNFEITLHDKAKSASELKPGDKLKVKFLFAGGMSSSPDIVENTPNLFAWKGSLPLGLFTGEHSFHFKPSEKSSGGTTLVQEEVFEGVFGFLMKEGATSAKKTKGHFEKFNADIKKKAESS